MKLSKGTPGVAMDWNQARAQYERDSFLLPDFRVSQETLSAISDAHERLIKRHPRVSEYCPALLDFDLEFLDFARDPMILDMFEAMIGPDIILWNMSFFAKPAHTGRRIPWHQDGEYWEMRPLATCTVWIAIDDTTTENGCMRVILGSHRSGCLLAHETNPSREVVLHEQLKDGQFNEADAVDLVLGAGQVSLHDVYMVHGSEPNRSEHSRRALTMRFMPSTSLYDRDVEAEHFKDLHGRAPTSRSIFLMRGEDRHGDNDFRVRPGINAPELNRG
ncbi:MAG: phytanoyl-CoA dioxygenase family protein [Alphaproteobacteria bacterium]|nr:phytanoyl-CoA dioxygenase family protein [Alphaproteobacteria bacterium]